MKKDNTEFTMTALTDEEGQCKVYNNCCTNEGEQHRVFNHWFNRWRTTESLIIGLIDAGEQHRVFNHWVNR